MAFEFKLPDIGEGVAEGEIVKWLVKDGDAVKRRPADGRGDDRQGDGRDPVAARRARSRRSTSRTGEICPVGKVLVVIDEDGAARSAAAATPPATATAATAATQRRADAPRTHAPVAATAPPQARRRRHRGRRRDAPSAARVLATPATRRLARELGVELGRVPADRPARPRHHGRRQALPATAPRRRRRRRRATAARHAPIAIADARGDEERVPLRGMRKRIAENDGALGAHRRALHLRRGGRRDRARRAARARQGARGRARRQAHLPAVHREGGRVAASRSARCSTRSLDEATQEIVRKKYYHIGIAAQGPQGLVVPVVRDADRRSIFDLAREIERLGEAARSGNATREELTGSTFTITLARQARRRARHADHQLPRGRHPRRPQDQGEAGGARRPDRHRAR